jgi:hypothetical protein
VGLHDTLGRGQHHDRQKHKENSVNKRLSIKANFAGVAIGIIGASLASVALAIAWGIPLDKMNSEWTGSDLLVADLLFSLSFVLLSGYVAGKIGKNDPVLNAIVVGAIQLTINLLALALVVQTNPSPVWYTAGSMLAIVPTTYLGGRIAMAELQSEGSSQVRPLSNRL